MILLQILSLIILIATIGVVTKGNDDLRYYAARRDIRKCDYSERPKCGGYYIKEINTGNDEPEIYITDINQQDDIDVINENNIKNAPPFHIIFRGSIDLNYENDLYQAYAHNIYRLLPIPGKTFNLTKEFKFYTLGHPNNLLVPKLKESSNPNDDSGEKFKVIKCSKYINSIPNVQKNWLFYLINTGNSVFTFDSIKLVNNSINPEFNYEIGELFISLTNSNNCPMKLQEIKCVSGLVATYVRKFDHCYIFFECVPKSNEKCNSAVPLCPISYSIVSIPSYPIGCPEYFCDPSFLYFNI